MWQVLDRAAALGAQRVPEEWKLALKRRWGVPTTEGSLLRLRRAGFRPAAAVDVGAYQGDWTRAFKRVFPEVRVLMIEPQLDLAMRLERVARQYNGVDVRLDLLGPEERSAVPFLKQETGSRVLHEQEITRHHETLLPMTTLDAVTECWGVDHIPCIKLDVQGYELEVLRGGPRTLADTEVVMMEVNLMRIIPEAPLFHEAVEFMGRSGFQLYDIAGLITRPFDGAVWQMDAVFVRRTSELLSTTAWV